MAGYISINPDVNDQNESLWLREEDNASNTGAFKPDPMMAKLAILSVVAVILVTTNGMLIFTILYHKHLHSKANYFVVALAASDFSTGFVAIPIHCMAEANVFGKGEQTCLITMCSTSCQIILSVLMLFALSVERYIKLVHPFQYAKYIHRKQVFVCIAFCTIYSLLVASLPLIGWNNLDPSQPNKDMEKCRYEIIMPGSYTMFVFGGHVGPAFVILPLLYFHIFCTAHQVLQRRSQNSANQTACKMYHQHHPDRATNSQRDSSTTLEENGDLQSQTPPKTKQNPAQRLFISFPTFRKHNPDYMCSCHSRSYRHFKILALAGAYFMVSWLPLVIWEVALTHGGTKNIITVEDYLSPPLSMYYYCAALGLAMANSAINPLLFGTGNITIRSAFLNTLVRCKTKSYAQEEHSFNTQMLMKEHEMHKEAEKNGATQKA